MRAAIAIICVLAGCSSDADSSEDVVCAGPNPTFPTFDKGCGVATDCFIALHETDCCGTLVAIGYSVSVRAQFVDDEAHCEAMYPACECPVGPTQAEEGQPAADNQLVVECVDHACTTAWVP